MSKVLKGWLCTVRTHPPPEYEPVDEEQQKDQESHGFHLPRPSELLPFVDSKARKCKALKALVTQIFDVAQMLVYIACLVTLFAYVAKLRVPDEYFLWNRLENTFVENTFDDAHNTFRTVRRIADIYEWGNNVFIPGLLGNAGPCAADVGAVRADRQNLRHTLAPSRMSLPLS
eukprot:3043448-Prymnesium_polylepis.1